MFAVSTVKEILQNPVYIGKIRYNVRQDWSKKRRNNINANPILSDGIHEPIIDVETWNKVQVILKERSKKHNKVYDCEFPLTGILRCPVCGAGMTISRSTAKRKDGTRRINEYYSCGNWKNKGTAVCNSNSIRVELADEYVLNKIMELINDETILRKVVDNINQNKCFEQMNQKKDDKNEKDQLPRKAYSSRCCAFNAHSFRHIRGQFRRICVVCSCFCSSSCDNQNS